ncbi:hypothetical protein C8F01DRAFT_1146705, partial [Mycena amicta]
LRQASSAPMDPRVATHRCSSCKTYKAITRDNFVFRNGAFLRTCLKCQNRRCKTQLGGDGDDDGEADKENEPAADDDDSELTVIELEDFLAIISMDESVRSFSALVDTAKTGKEKGRNLADLIAEEIHSCIDYKFNKHDWKNLAATTFNYHCAQLEKRQLLPSKHDDAEKHRDRRQMLTFKCDGWLSIRVDDDSQLALVKLKHALDHVPYGRRQMPNAVKDFILQHCDMKTPEVR